MHFQDTSDDGLYLVVSDYDLYTSLANDIGNMRFSLNRDRMFDHIAQARIGNALTGMRGTVSIGRPNIINRMFGPPELAIMNTPVSGPMDIDSPRTPEDSETQTPLQSPQRPQANTQTPRGGQEPLLTDVPQFYDDPAVIRRARQRAEILRATEDLLFGMLNDRVLERTLQQSFNEQKTYERDDGVNLRGTPLVVTKELAAELNGNSCPICLEDFQVDDKAFHSDCHHYTHFNCLDEWVKYKPECPVCRAAS